MAGATVQIQGVYRVPLTDKLFAEAMELKYGGENLSSQERIETEAGVREELSSVVLIDVVVNDGGEGLLIHMESTSLDSCRERCHPNIGYRHPLR
jgi:hypothetical protein